LSVRRLGLALQAGYYVSTGLWAVAHRRSFEAVTGPKTDYWLVRLVGALAAAMGASLALGARRDRPGAETVALGLAGAAAFAATDAVYVARGRIGRVYLGDLAVEAALGALVAARGRVGRG
jgi:hypothetical protein